MLNLSQWFSRYAESHQNSTNIAIHKIAVPLIYFSVVCFLVSIPNLIGDVIFAVFALAVLAFYARLSLKLFTVMTLFTALCVYIAFSLNEYLLYTAISIFVIAWIFQFVGHKIEGKKPSFFDDLFFLLIGPAWVFDPIFKFNKDSE
jgi:uncharacterized membrane protein YGL010W